ncbi:hypothetical protein AVEN_150712-1, partial [Araneus ventricosus]
DCIMKTMEADYIAGYVCNECGQTTNLRRQAEMSKLPPVLVIQILRYLFVKAATKLTWRPLDFVSVVH